MEDQESAFWDNLMHGGVSQATFSDVTKDDASKDDNHPHSFSFCQKTSWLMILLLTLLTATSAIIGFSMSTTWGGLYVPDVSIGTTIFSVTTGVFYGGLNHVGDFGWATNFNAQCALEKRNGDVEMLMANGELREKLPHCEETCVDLGGLNPKVKHMWSGALIANPVSPNSNYSLEKRNGENNGKCHVLGDYIPPSLHSAFASTSSCEYYDWYIMVNSSNSLSSNSLTARLSTLMVATVATFLQPTGTPLTTQSSLSPPTHT